MGELVDRDLEHLRLLKIGYYVIAGMTGLFSLLSLIYIGLGTVFASGVIPANNGDNGSPKIVGLIFLGIGVLVLLIGLTTAFLTYYAGKSLEERRRRVFCLVIAALCCFQIPWGTAIGVFTFIVLGRPSVRALFGDPQPVGTTYVGYTPPPAGS